jgi:filamentous hemagglutinin
MDHVRARHFGGTNSQSQFSIAADELSSILQSGVVREAPLQQIGTGRQAMWLRDVDIGRIIGRTRVSDGASPTSMLRVFVDEAGNLITTFPVPGI